MRKTNLFGATFLALTTGAWSLAAVAQTAAPAPAAPAPAAPAPAAPVPAPEAAPAAPAPEASAPAPAPEPIKKKPMHHKMMSKGKLAPTKAGDKAVEDLNDASLNAAKTGKPFMAPTTPDAAKKEAHVGDKGAAPMHHHHKMMMKKTTKPADSAAPPAESTTPPADSTPK